MSWMNRRMHRFGLAALVALSGGISTAPGQEEEKKTGWSDSAELSVVATAGNSESTTLGFKNTLIRDWERAQFTFKAAGIRAESASGDRIAMQTTPAPTPFVVIDPPKELSAENYIVDAKYGRNITDRLTWQSSIGWERNRFAGIENRYVASAGLGNVWHDREDLKFRTEYSVTYTDQEDVTPTPGVDDSFAGIRLLVDYLNQLGENSTYTTTLVIDENVDETDDWRADWVHGFGVSLNRRVALKVSLTLLYDNLPSLEQIALYDNLGVNTGTTVTNQLDELDTIFSTSLVVSF